MPNLIGTAPNQVPVNGLLGTLAFQDSTSVKVDSLTATSVTATAVTGALTGNATSVTNGVYTTGDQTIGGNKTFSNTILGSISGATGTFTGNIQATSYNGGQLAGLRNQIINGNMGIAQRGTAAVTTNNTYGPADRWFTSSAGSTFSTSQGSFVSGDALYDTGGARNFTQVAVTSVAGAGNYVYLSQRIEDVSLLAGQTVTVSFWAKAVSGTPLIGLEVWQNFGAGGSPSASVGGIGQSQTLTTTWTKYSKTFSVPSINGKTIGTTANTSYVGFTIWLDAGSTYNTSSGSIGQSSKTVSIAQVQLEIGSVATPFEQRPGGMELALCQRYFFNNATGAMGAYTAGSLLWLLQNVPFPVQMRTTPGTITQPSGFTIQGVTSSATGFSYSATATYYSIVGADANGVADGVCRRVDPNSNPSFSAEL